MKLLKNKRAWKKWSKDQSPTYNPEPSRFPCYAYTHCISFGMEEDEALYLYHEDLMRMATETAPSLFPDNDSRCRDCADHDGICPHTNTPCKS